MKHEYITENRVVPYISDVDICLDDKKGDSSLDSNSSLEYNNFENFLLVEDIFNVNEENVDEIFAKLQENFKEYTFVKNCIEYALKIRPKQTKNLCLLLTKISDILGEHKRILLHKGIFEEGSVEGAIKEDLIDKLIEISANPDFNPMKKLKINQYQALYFVTENIEKNIFWKETQVSYLQLMAYFGSVKCFKYAIMNGGFDESELSVYAVAGGNNEIIHLLEQKDVSFDDCFEVSVKYHRCEISDWLLKNYKCEKFELFHAVEYFNIRSFFFLIKNGFYSSVDSLNSALIASTKLGVLPVVKYLFKNGANIEAKDRERKTPLYYANTNGHIEIVKYLVENCHANIDTKIINESLIYASLNGHIEVVKYLVESCHADVETKDKKGRTPLNSASLNGHIEIVKYLVENCHANFNDYDIRGLSQEERDSLGLIYKLSEKGDLTAIKKLISENSISVKQKYNGKTPLNIALENGHVDIVKYLVENCHAIVET